MYMTFDSCIDITKALADATRLRIVALLEGMELSVNEITSVIGTGQSGVSRHLKILADSGILECRKDGLWSFYITVKEGSVREIFSSLLKELFKSEQVITDRTKGAEQLALRSKNMVGYFNAVAREWDAHRNDILDGFDLDAEILKYIGKDPVADIGCGNGVLAETVAKKGFRVIGVDASPKMIEAARKRVQSVSVNSDFRIGECEHLPLRDNEVSTVLAVLVFHHLSNPQTALEECARAVKRGGSVIIADFDTHKSEKLRDEQHDLRLGVSKKELALWCKGAGLSVQSEKRFKLTSGLTLVFTIAIK
jgi:2-polyprenyl-3-methyl-5-hydroxy-6-metoxy-1,4-benzoquinol methylase/DNA-binding transcriptional ArsR family regulator